jgi:hypothetical protein
MIMPMTKLMMMMIMMTMIISLFGQPHSHQPLTARDVFTLTADHQMMMITIIISPFGQLGLLAPSSGVQDVFTSTA